MRFRYTSLPMRVSFGAGLVDSVATEVAELGLNRVLVLCTPRQQALAGRISRQLGDLSAGVHAQARMHVPIESARHAGEVARTTGADGCVAVGGGSTTGLAKAVALEFGLPIVAVPTTYAGSEMTPVWGLTINGEKKTGRDPRVLPAAVVYDPGLTVDLPKALSVTSGFNAIAHGVEALYAPDRSPLVSLMAEGGVRAMLGALPLIVANDHDLRARSDALYGAWLCGATLGATTMSLHHKLCHVLGGTFDLPHAEVHTVVLPYVLAFNAAHIPDAMAALRRATGSSDPVTTLWRLSRDLGAPGSLAELGMPESGIEHAAELATKSAYANPRIVTTDAARALLGAAWHGKTVPLPERSEAERTTR